MAACPLNVPLTLRRTDQLMTDITNLESGLEIIITQLASQPTLGDLAKTALGVMFCRAAITTPMTW